MKRILTTRSCIHHAHVSRHEGTCRITGAVCRVVEVTSGCPHRRRAR